MENPGRREAELAAAAWMVRLDRGLSPAEQDAFFEWMGMDPAHGAALARLQGTWKRLDNLAEWRPEHGDRPNPDLLAPRPSRAPAWQGALPWLAAAAAGLAAAVWVGREEAGRPVAAAVSEVVLKHEVRQILPDGSTMKLKEGAVAQVEYSARERRVRMEEGEAFFIVEKDAARPFVVAVNGVDVRAVGTSFNVRVDAQRLEVLVAEGAVEVTSPAAARWEEGAVHEEVWAEPAPMMVEAQQRAVIPFLAEQAEPQVQTMSREGIREALTWQHGLMTFDAKPLTEIVAELNRLNTVQLVIVDPQLEGLQFSGTFRSDNAEGFARLLESSFGARAEVVGGQEILLRAKSR